MSQVLTMLEGKWFPQNHLSVRELFEPIFTVWTNSGNSSFHYEQFTTDKGFRAAIRLAFSPNRAQAIYIGAHGDKNAIHGFHDEGINRTVIRNAIRAQKGTTKRGVYFGACSFVHVSTARFLLPSCPRVMWLAGYHEEVDWIDSSALDLFFFRHYLYPTPVQGRKTPQAPMARFMYAVNRIKLDIGPLANRLGFHAYIRNRRGRVIDLMESEDA